MAVWLPRLLLLLWVFAVSGAGPSLAQRDRVLTGSALIVGQSDYQHLPRLANPVNDARHIEETLRSLGFEPTLATDLNAKRLRRAIGNFADDAEGADVAVVYYSGHGIEAAGENWLILVDAGVSTLNESGNGLVALSTVIASLKGRVSLVLVFLDACRSNPFPPGAAFRTEAGEEVSIAASGLAVTRGVSAAGSVPPTGDIGTLIGFAAEPGRAALDGPPGGNSPYASALMRHLAAMDGAEFGTVMRLVTEEVYLKTGGEQRPWVNETLTRLIYLGVTPPVPAGDEAHILAERRQLLLTITALPAPAREQVEATAQTEGVPMDALYGLLRALGSDIPSDPSALDKLLNADARRVKDLMAAQRALASEDPEIKRLAGLAEKALRDGALDAHLAFWQQARERYLAAAIDLDRTEAQLKARRIEGGDVLANTAAAFELKADFRSAAETYAQAFAQVDRWDAGRAREYKWHEALAWLSEGDEKGDNDAVAMAIARFHEALALAPRADDPVIWARIQSDLGNALLVQATRGTEISGFDAALAAYGAAVEELRRDNVPKRWARVQNNIALAYGDLAERSGESRYVGRAIAAFRAALSQISRSEDPLLWATMMSNLGNALTQQGGDSLVEAVATHRAVLEERPRERWPILWAMSQENLGNALNSLGAARRDPALISQAISAHGLALEAVSRDSLPLVWAGIHYNRGKAYADLGNLEDAEANLRQAVAAYRDALKEERYDRAPLAWAKTQYMLGEALWKLGEQVSDMAMREDAVGALRQSLTFYMRARNPADWAITLYGAGIKLHRLGVMTQDAGRLAEAAEMLSQSLGYYTRDRNAEDWADTLGHYAVALADHGFATASQPEVEAAIAAYRKVMEVETREVTPLKWAADQLGLASALYFLAVLRNEDELARQGREAVLAAADVFAAEGRPDKAAATKALLADFDALIQRLQP